MSLFIHFIGLFMVIGAVTGQLEEDPRQINPDVCGLTAQKVRIKLEESSSSSERKKRLVNSSVADQREWGWQVMLFSQEGLITCGSLINSQWVLSYAVLSE